MQQAKFSCTPPVSWLFLLVVALRRLAKLVARQQQVSMLMVVEVIVQLVGCPVQQVHTRLYHTDKASVQSSVCTMPAGPAGRTDAHLSMHANLVEDRMISHSATKPNVLTGHLGVTVLQRFVHCMNILRNFGFSECESDRGLRG